MNAHVQSSLSNLEERLNGLLVGLTVSPNAAGTPEAAVALLEADDAVTSALTTLRQHQQNYSKILQLRAEATRLDEQVRKSVRDIEAYEKEIRIVCDDDDDDDDSSESESEENDRRPKSKEVDYRLLLDFARRISKYNHQASARVGALKNKDKAGQDVVMNGGAKTTAEPVSSVTKNATTWLDESAKQTRQVYMMPYPTEDRIRMGLMGQIQQAASESVPGLDPDKEVDRLIRESEGFGSVTSDSVPAHPSQLQASEGAHWPEGGHPHGPNKTAPSHPTVPAGEDSGAAPPAPRARNVTLDLDLYDPNDDDI